MAIRRSHDRCGDAFLGRLAVSFAAQAAASLFKTFRSAKDVLTDKERSPAVVRLSSTYNGGTCLQRSFENFHSLQAASTDDMEWNGAISGGR